MDKSFQKVAPKTEAPWQLVLLAAVLFAAIFALDLHLPLGVAGGVPYVAVVLLGWWFPKRNHIIILAAISAVFTIAGYFYSPFISVHELHASAHWKVIANRGLALFVIWLSAILLFIAKRAEEKIKKINEELEQRVEERTKELRANEERFQAFMDHTNSPISIKNREGKILFANRTYLHWTGFEDREIVGNAPNKIYNPKDSDKILLHDQRVFDAGKPMAEERTVDFPDGVTRTILSRKFPIFDTEGNVYATGSILSDLTERKKAEEAVISSKTDAEYANYAKTQFLANMSHELRTPLNSIIGFSQILKGEGIAELKQSQSRDYATDINNSANHLLALIQDILDVSKIEAGELELFKEPINLNKLVHDCVVMVEERAKEGGISLSVKIAKSLPPIEADEVRIKQVLLNLIGNAIKFTPDGGKVEVSVETDGDNAVLLKVDDTGIGIKKADIPKVLKPFGQVKDIMHRNHEGTGLGLSLAKSLTELHGGNLALTSNVGKGTSVTVKLPNGHA